MKYSDINPGLRIHAVAFVITLIALAGIDWWFPKPMWVHWVFLGWGAGLTVHAWFALGGKRAA